MDKTPEIDQRLTDLYKKHLAYEDGGVPAVAQKAGILVSGNDSPKASLMAIALVCIDELRDLRKRVEDLEKRAHYHAG